MRISIIGGGPAGTYTAYKLAKEGFKVRVYEEHNQIGMPVQCTGIVTSALKKVIPEDENFVINKIREVKVFSPSGKSLNFKLKNPNLILDRTKFDKHIAEMAEYEGAKIFLKHKFLGVQDGKIKINNEVIKTDCLIGADGPNSAVAKSTGMSGERSFVIGHQARIKKPINSDLVEFWMGIGKFAWLVPESENVARIGIVAEKNPKTHFKKFLQKKGIKKGKILNFQSGIIPMYNPKLQTQKDNVFLIGDAATMVKPTTYGGIVQGLMAAEELAKSVTQNKKSYETLWKKKLGKDLWLALMIRKAMDKFAPKDYNELLEKLGSQRTRNVLETHDRDFAIKIVPKLLLLKPSLLKFGTKII